MGKITESALRSALKAGKFERVYFLYGEEDFLTRTYTDMIVQAAVPDSARDMNLVVYRELPDNMEEISDYLESLPFFSDYKCVLIKDINIDALDNAKHKSLLSIAENIPDTSILIFSQRAYPIDTKKPKAKTKKLLEVCEKAGVTCEFKYLSASKIADMVRGKFQRLNCSISNENAAFLAEECGGSLTVLQTEIEKLASYKGSGEITGKDIEELVPKRVVSNIYNLAKELFAGRTGSALRILDALFVQRTEPVVIMATLSGHFTDLYRARLGIDAGVPSQQAARAFGYAANRSFVMDNAYRGAGGLSADYLGKSIAVLYRTNKALNSTSADKRILIERALAEIAAIER